MQVLLDGLPIPGDFRTVSSAVDAARGAAESAGRIIIEAKGDGRVLSTTELDNALKSESDFVQVDFRSADPILLVTNSLQDAADGLGQVKAVHAAAASAFQRGEGEAGLAHLQSALQTWQVVRDLAEQTCRLMGLNPQSIVVPGVHGEIPFDHAVALMVKRLKEVQSALTAQDWSALADTVGYEMDALADVWISLLQGMSDMIRRSRRTGDGA
jgi:hypothetical protein